MCKIPIIRRKLTTQHRVCVSEKKLNDIAKPTRQFHITKFMLQRLIGTRRLRDHPDGVLKAWKKESVLVEHIFDRHVCLGRVETLDEGPIDNYKGLRIMVTRHFRKSIGIVNGATGVVVSCLSRSNVLCQFDD